MMSSIAENLQTIRAKIAGAVKKAGRSAEVIQLIAVSKTKSEEDVRIAIAAGQKIFGENRVQEAKAKFTSLRSEQADLELQLIGPLQTNKADDAVRLFDVIATLDRASLAEALSHSIKKIGRTPRLYVEINIGNEPQKAGVAPDELEAFLKFCRDKCSLTIEGLMCIPPQGKDPEPYFRTMKLLADRHNLKKLSMGMSGDYKIAIACGATEVRIGAAIFGER